jgi:beta-glucosidase
MQITSFNTNSLDDYLNQRHIRYFILRDNLPARELAARANASQEAAEKSRLGIPIVFTSNPRNHVRRRVSSILRHPALEFTDLFPLSCRRLEPAC